MALNELLSRCPPMLEIQVDCYSGYRGEETPRQIQIGTRKITVVEVLDLWLSPDHRYFKILGDDQGLYIIRHDPHAATWQLTFFKQSSEAGQEPSL